MVARLDHVQYPRRCDIDVIFVNNLFVLHINGCVDRWMMAQGCCDRLNKKWHRRQFDPAGGVIVFARLSKISRSVTSAHQKLVTGDGTSKTYASELQSSSESCSSFQPALGRNHHWMRHLGDSTCFGRRTTSGWSRRRRCDEAFDGAALRDADRATCWPCLTTASTSSRVIRPPSPVPITPAKSTPTSRAKRRIAGPAAITPPGSNSSPTSCAGGGLTAIGLAGAGGGATGCTGAAGLEQRCRSNRSGRFHWRRSNRSWSGSSRGRGRCNRFFRSRCGRFGGAADSAVSSMQILLLQPRFARQPHSFLTILPAYGLGTVTVALSVSSSICP